MKTLNLVVKSTFYEVSTNHSRATKLGILHDIYTVNNFISGYIKCGHLGVAHHLFDEMSERRTCSWNSIIAGYVNSGSFYTSWCLLNDMRRSGFSLDGYTFGSLLKGIACTGEIGCGEQLHSLVVKTGCDSNVFTGCALLDMYAKCGRIYDAHIMFMTLPNINSVSCNAMIAGFVDRGEFDIAFEVLCNMEKEGLKIGDGTVAPLLTLVNKAEYMGLTMQLHGKIIKSGLVCNNIVCNALLTSYSECGTLENADKLFYDTFDVHDSVTWNSMLAAYLLHHKPHLLFQLFHKMQDSGFEPDIYTYTSVVSACFEEGFQLHGRCIHSLIIKSGLEGSTAIANALIAMYVKSGGKFMTDALRLFESIEPKDSVSWNSVLTGFTQFGLSEDALEFFGNMRSHDVGIDHYSFSAVLRSCADVAALYLGQQVHVLALKSGLQSNEHVASSLILMYSKCGLLDHARRSFEDTPKDSSITWNFTIFGYAQHGQGEVALELFHQMTESKVELDHITFVAVLTACSHMGWVEEGRRILKTMESDYGIPPRMEHYACAIDLYGRAGLIEEVKALLKSMPFEADAMVWKTVLGACRNCGDVELASQVANRLLELDPEEHCTYVILSDMYGRHKMWEEKAGLTRLMRDRGVKKVPGWSWIEINNETHAFNAQDTSHPNSKQIFDILVGLTEEIRMRKVSSNTKVYIEDLDSIQGCHS